MPLSREEVIHIATLCRIGMTDEEMDRIADHLSHILEQFKALDQVDTDDVPPTAQSIDTHSVFKEDASRPSLSQEETLKNAPMREGEFLRIKAVLED